MLCIAPCGVIRRLHSHFINRNVLTVYLQIGLQDVSGNSLAESDCYKWEGLFTVVWLTTEASNQFSLRCAIMWTDFVTDHIVCWNASCGDGWVYRNTNVHSWVWIGFSTTDWRPRLDLQFVFVTDRMALHSVHSDVHKVTWLARSFTEYPHRCWRSRTSRQRSRRHYCIAVSWQVCPLCRWISAVLFLA